MHSVTQVQLLKTAQAFRSSRVVVQCRGHRPSEKSAMAASIMGDDAKALANEEQRLAIPIIAAERPPMVEHDWLGVFRAPVLVEDFNAIPVVTLLMVMPLLLVLPES